jgi:hypothetical protein
LGDSGSIAQDMSAPHSLEKYGEQPVILAHLLLPLRKRYLTG